MQTKKWASRLSVLTLATAFALTGCGSATNSNSGGSAANAGGTNNAGTANAGGDAAANGAAASGDASGGAPVTIRFNMGDGEVTKEQIDAFNKEHPNIKLVRVDSDYNKLMAQVAANSPDTPDLIRVQGSSEIPFYVSRGLALNLDPYFENSAAFPKDDILDIANVYRFDGTMQGQGPIYGFPKDWSPDYDLWVNKKMFTEAGIPLPSDKEPMTYDEMLDLAKKLTKKQNGKITQYGLVDMFTNGVIANQDLLLHQLASLGEQLYSDKGIELDTPDAKKALQYWVDAVKAPVGPSPLNTETKSFIDLFTQNKSAMMLCGYWFSGLLRTTDSTKNNLDDYMLLPSPMMDGGKRVEAARGASGSIIYSKTKHPKEAWTVFEWFYSGQMADERAKSGWGLPVFQSKMALLPQETAFDKQAYGVVKDDLDYIQVLGYSPFVASQAITSTFDQQFTPVYFDKSTIDDAIGKISKNIADLMQDNKDLTGN
ncbi:sugar ABC transporter substrate-binding protein [Paenibacillus lycopersici]|uniref:Sugar ABC transporter substrate-binding protein n=1 Tax=Paenibacillus lycopersici TaxID=2704462 RepID=A0A6C0FWU3_9BACL|nr:sugar ABC transporter substrate-binding protein [Paenibacillus lycopersici]QHT59429.1 sugar ABC transporter substrate-binding protein [Paenibacillus lycopersici]